MNRTEAIAFIRSRWPYFDRAAKAKRANHIFMPMQQDAGMMICERWPYRPCSYCSCLRGQADFRRFLTRHHAAAADPGMDDLYVKTRKGPLAPGEAWVDALPDELNGSIFLTFFGLEFGQMRIQSKAYGPDNRTDWWRPREGFRDDWFRDAGGSSTGGFVPGKDVAVPCALSDVVIALANTRTRFATTHRHLKRHLV